MCRTLRPRPDRELQVEFVALVLALAVVVLAVGVAQLRRQLRAAEAELAAVHATEDTLQPGRDMILIEITNHHDVAAQRTRLARGVSLVAPGIIRGIVHREAVKKVRAQLAYEGVDAEVRVRRVHDCAIHPTPVVEPSLPDASAPAATPGHAPSGDAARPAAPVSGAPAAAAHDVADQTSST